MSPTVAFSHHAEYSLSLIDPPEKGQVFPTAINSSGSILCTFADSHGPRSFVYADGKLTAFTLAGWDRCELNAINSAGVIAGRLDSQAKPGHAMMAFGTDVKDLGIVGTASGINNSGLIVGALRKASGSAEIDMAFLDADGSVKELGTLGGEQSRALGVNALGTVVGSADMPLNTPGRAGHWFTIENGKEIDLGFHGAHAFVYREGKMSDLGTLGGSFSEARGVNDAGDVVGWAMTKDNTGKHPFLYRNGKMTDLGVLKGGHMSRSENGDYAEAWSINSKGQIVGLCAVKPGRAHGFLYENGRMRDLNDLVDSSGKGYIVWTATSINDQGQILVQAIRISDSRMHMALLTPLAR